MYDNPCMKLSTEPGTVTHTAMRNLVLLAN